MIGGFNGAGMTAISCNVVISDGTGTVRAVFTSTGALSLGNGFSNFGAANNLMVSQGADAAPTWTDNVTVSSIKVTSGLIINSNAISTSTTILAGENAMSAGPITVNTGVTVTISSGSRWVIL